MSGNDKDKKKLKKTKQMNQIDWPFSTNASVRSMFYYRKKHGLPIESELEQELVKRFKFYDAKTQTFLGKKIGEKKERAVSWKKSTDIALRAAVGYRKGHNLPIEPELEHELIKRFPGYDAKTQMFTGKGGRRFCKTGFYRLSDIVLRNMFYYRKRHALSIEPELEQELVKRFPGYDAKTHSFVAKKVRVVDWSTRSNEALRTMFYYRKKHGLPIEPDLEQELIKRFPGYDAKTKTFGRRPPKKINWAKLKDTSLRVLFGRRKSQGLPIEPDLEQELIKRFPGYDVKTKTFIGQLGKKKKEVKSDNVVTRNVEHPSATEKTIEYQPEENSLVVSVRAAAKRPGYNNIYVNGNRILAHHKNTEIKIMFDGALLGVRGIFSSDYNFPDAPVWQVYDTQLQPKIVFGNGQKYGGYSPFSRNIYENQAGLRIDLSNRAQWFFKADAIRRNAMGRKFVMEKVK